MKILMFSGPGNSGKTSLMQALEALAAQRALRVKIMPSTTRKSYAVAGKGSEQADIDDPNAPEFQDQVMLTFMNEAVAFAKAQSYGECDLLIYDRTPYDYAAYYMQRFAANLKINTINTKRNLADLCMAQLGQACSDLVVTPLPWPMPWNKDQAESSDGWRADKTGKNFLWNCVVMNELTEAFRRPILSNYSYGINAPKRLHRLVPFAETGSIEVRAANTLANLFPDHIKYADPA
jgi:hypothetical protein